MKNQLVEIKDYLPDATIDIRYATSRNITGQKIYDKAAPKLLPMVAEALKSVQRKLTDQDLRLVIWDAYRPPKAQKLLRQFCSDDKYVAPISNHSRGVTVDVTLAEKNSRNYLDMGTDLDEFTEKAHVEYRNLTAEQKRNRQTLKEAMESVGFKQLDTEWWHFDFVPLLKSEVLDLEEAEVAA